MKKSRKLVISGVGILTAGVLLATSLLGSGEVAQAAYTRMYGVQKIVNDMSEASPFTILEIVPDEAYASFGYYVTGQEPEIPSKLLKNATSEAERKAQVLKLYSGIANNLISYNEADVYEEQLDAPADMTGWSMIETGQVTQERTGRYEEAINHGREYGDYTRVEVSQGTDIPSTDPSGNPDANVPAAQSEEASVSQTSVQTTGGTTATGGIQQMSYTKLTPLSTDTGDGLEESGDGTEAEPTETPTPEVTETPTPTPEATAEPTPTPEPVYTYTYTPGTGTYVWVDDATNGTTQAVTFENIYYRTNVTSNDLFAKSVLELESGANIKVLSMTPQEVETKLQTGELSWNQVDLLYLSATGVLNFTSAGISSDMLSSYTMENGAEVNPDNDLTWDTAYQIYQYTVDSKMPVMVDQAIINQVGSADAVTLLSNDNNVLRLAYLLKAYTEDTTMNTYDFSQASAIAQVVTDANVSANYSEWVTGNVYGGLNLVNSSLNAVKFNSASQSTSIYGSQKVVEEIETENFYNELNGVDFTSEHQTDGSLNVSQATLMKYILNYANRRVELNKERIRVLDIEPTKYSQLTEDTIRGWLNEAGDDVQISDIDIVQTTTAEFIGKMEDLVEEYDLIYIGSCLGNGSLVGSKNLKIFSSDDVVDYNNDSLDGLIYSSQGDNASVQKNVLAGLLDSDYNSNGSYNGGYLEYMQTEYSENDITEAKLEELKEFADSGYPVVISSEYFNGTSIRTDRVGSSSNMYKFMSAYTGTNAASNVLNEGSINASTLARYINMPKLSLSLISAPVEYAVTYSDAAETKIGAVTYLQPLANGNYELKYSFELSDLSGALADGTAYKVQLFVDGNADGQFSSYEEQLQLTVTDASNVPVAVDKLQTGVRYTMKKELSSDYAGIIQWKLKVSLVTADGTESSVHNSATGCTYIKGEEATTIKALQIIPSSGSALKLNDTNNRIGQLFADLNDKKLYNLEVTVNTIDEYITAYGQYTDAIAFYEGYLSSYDMLVVGFGDMYANTTPSGSYSEAQVKGAVDGIDLFVESGKSVVFSHDTTTYKNIRRDKKSDNYWAYYLNQCARKNSGMDRYGILENAGSTQTGKEGFNNILLDKQAFGLGWLYKMSMRYYDKSGFTENTTAISQVNQGQITSYPYDVNINMASSRETVSVKSFFGPTTTYEKMSLNTATVSTTHAQYYQLDVERDVDNDGISDVIVWYSLAHDGAQYGAYAAMPNDVRNNYYIYSCGNVTYTGLGHSSDITDYEAKLFVNTIIAAYNLGIKNPNVSILETKDDVNSSLEKVYRTFDDEIALDSDEDQYIYYHVTDSNQINGTKTINMTYYYEVTGGGDGIKEWIDENGKTIYLKPLGNAVCNENQVYEIQLSADTINSVLADQSEMKIYIFVETTLTYKSGRSETTDAVCDILAIKKRSLFNLD